jgi:hypothetical protein
LKSHIPNAESENSHQPNFCRCHCQPGILAVDTSPVINYLNLITITTANLYLEGNANNLPPSTLQYSKKFWDILPAFNISSSVVCLTTSAAAQISRPFPASREVKFLHNKAN